MPWSSQVFGVQDPEPHLPPLQVWPDGHMPQLMTPLQPSLAKPHCCPDGHAAAGVQVILPHLFATGGLPTPHISPFLQTPHATRPPQPSGAKPQSCPAGQVVAGTQIFGGGTHEPRSKIMNSRVFSCAFIGSTQRPFAHVLAQSAPVVQAEPQGHFLLVHAPWQLASVVQVAPHCSGYVRPCSLAS